MALVGSIAVHVACGLALIAVRSAPVTTSTERAQQPLEPLEPLEIIELVELSAPSGGGGTPGSGAARSKEPARTERVARVDRSSRREIVRTTPTEQSLSDSLAELASASQEAGGDGGDGGGRGGGHGAGVGRGVGSGLGDRATIGDQLPAVPAAPQASKARPAKLIYPTRERPASEGELYSARVTIDADGYVVGARLLHSAATKDADAAAMIFRFRYAPALDDDGRPIRSTIEQPFLVQ